MRGIEQSKRELGDDGGVGDRGGVAQVGHVDAGGAFAEAIGERIRDGQVERARSRRPSR